MAAINAPRFIVTPERPTTTGSWDDLINRNRGRSRNSTTTTTYSQVFLSENEQRRWAQGENRKVPSSIGETGSDNNNHPRAVPGPSPSRRMMVHHPDQRTSMAFAAHVASLNGRPSPLSMSVSSDSLPKPNPHVDTVYVDALDNFRPNAHYPPRPSMYPRPQRMSDVPRMADYQLYDAVPPAPRNRMRTVSWSGSTPPNQDELTTQTYHPHRDSPGRNSGGGGWLQRPERIKHFRIPRSKPNEVFHRLPAEVLSLILDHLHSSHLDPQSHSCATCWMRNCCAVALCNKKMLPVARAALYEHIQLVGPDNPAQTKRYKNMHSSRLVLLRRSLRADHKLAELVQSLKVPALAHDAGVDARDYHDVVASIVMACPNLERLDGFYPIYDHGHSRLFNALGSRASLKDMTWIIDAPPSDQDPAEGRARRSQSRTSVRRRSQSRGRQSKSRSSSVAAPSASVRHINSRGYLVPELANKFVLHHTYWKELTSLTIHCLPGANLSTPNDLIAVVLTYLPSIKTLCLSNVSARSFDDDTLLATSTPLTKLSLTHCPGVTTSGLAAFASGPAASTLETLTLVHQDLDSLAAIVRILSKLSKLSQLSVVQALAPKLSDDTFVWLMPYLASPSLKSLHWDILENGGPSSTEADDILARSILAGGFPSLRKLRVPQDPGGMFQALCRPNERIDLPGDRYLNLVAGARSHGRAHATNPSSSTHLYHSGDAADGGGRMSSETGDSAKGFLPTREAGSDLHQARLAAQARLEAARRFPRFEINVTDETGQLVESAGLAGFLGDVMSKVAYCLTPEWGGTDERGGLVGVAELLGDGGEDLTDKGDLATRSGAGYGTGCVAHVFSRAQKLAMVEAAATSSPSSKLSSGGGNKKLTKHGALHGVAAGGKHNKSQGGACHDSADAGTGPKTKEGCTGRNGGSSYYINNSGDDAPANKKNKHHDRDPAWHTERGRWRGRVEVA